MLSAELLKLSDMTSLRDGWVESRSILSNRYDPRLDDLVRMEYDGISSTGRFRVPHDSAVGKSMEVEWYSR